MKEYVNLLRSGQLVAIPTETVYGLAADATNAKAVSEIYRLKGRPSFNPLIIHCHSIAQAEQYCVFSDIAYRLATKFWPGAMTLVLPLKEQSQLCGAVTAGLTTVGVRIPDHPLTLNLLKQLDVPLAAPSANISGKISPTKPDHIRRSFQDLCPPILDGGMSKIGIESTIIGFDLDHNPILLRHGAIPVESIEYTIGSVKTYDGDMINAPGQIKSHYAPNARLVLDSISPLSRDGFLAFGESIPPQAKIVYQLSKQQDLFEAASNLFDGLHYLDSKNIQSIHVAPIPKTSIGIALYDRLSRAAYQEES